MTQTDQQRQQAIRDGASHWLVQPKTIRLLWWISGIVLALTVIAQIWIHIHAYFTVDGWPGFYAGFGFLSCVAMVIFAKALGWALKRPDDYYDKPTKLAPSVLGNEPKEPRDHV